MFGTASKWSGDSFRVTTAAAAIAAYLLFAMVVTKVVLVTVVVTMVVLTQVSIGEFIEWAEVLCDFTTS